MTLHHFGVKRAARRNLQVKARPMAQHHPHSRFHRDYGGNVALARDLLPAMRWKQRTGAFRHRWKIRASCVPMELV